MTPTILSAIVLGLAADALAGLPSALHLLREVNQTVGEVAGAAEHPGAAL